ncbi:MAG: hypothetical protein B7Y61_25065 [Rhizobiales bacterium 35-66-30]|nr:MAG: hypothetical protein B7Y61_25065 [Rhizobiales bacterium 35-66-30]
MPLIDYIPAQTHFGFMRLRHVTFPLSAAAMVLALVCFATFGFTCANISATSSWAMSRSRNSVPPATC